MLEAGADVSLAPASEGYWTNTFMCAVISGSVVSIAILLSLNHANLLGNAEAHARLGTAVYQPEILLPRQHRHRTRSSNNARRFLRALLRGCNPYYRQSNSSPKSKC
jgi:hypothetical protein